jgi:hypothetical protein
MPIKDEKTVMRLIDRDWQKTIIDNGIETTAKIFVSLTLNIWRSFLNS